MEAPLALYRRYRPETFSEVIGQDHVTVPLRNALSNNRVNHAYLFSGPRGCGKTTSARILARAINCEKGPIAEPCGVCKSCTDLARGGPGSIDVIEIDAASHGGVDDARDLRERAFFSPVESRYKIYIIDEAHMVTTQGFNALLKLVEEPPPHLKFIFATTEPDKVIGTIRSRTHHYPFRLVPPKVLGDYLAHLCEAEGVAIAPAALPLVVRAGAGSVRDSLSVLDQLIGGAGPDGVTYELAVALLGFTPDSLLDACVDGFAAHDSKAVFETIEKVIETGQDPKRFAEDLLHRLRDLVILSAVPNAVASGLIEAAEDQGERLQTQAAGIGAAELTRAADIVAAGLLEMRGATAPRLQLELICAKVLLPGADDSTNGIQARLDRLERRLTIGGAGVGSSGTASAGAAADLGAAPGGGVDGPADASSARGSAGGASAGVGARGESSGAAAESSGAAAGSTVPARGSVSHPGGAQASQEQPAHAAGGQGDHTPATQEPPAQRPQQSPAAASVAPAAAAPVSTASVGLADVRRLWPEVLEAVKGKRRFAWIMLSQNAQVLAIDDQTLTVGLVNAGARESFSRSGSDEILRQALIDTIGLNRRIEAVVDPSTDPGAGQSAAQSPPPASSASSSSWDRPAQSSSWDQPPSAEPSGNRSGGPGGTSNTGASPQAGSAGAAQSDPDNPSSPGTRSTASPEAHRTSSGTSVAGAASSTGGGSTGTGSGSIDGGFTEAGGSVGGFSGAGDEAVGGGFSGIGGGSAAAGTESVGGGSIGAGGGSVGAGSAPSRRGQPTSAVPDVAGEPAVDQAQVAASKRRTAEAAVAAEQAQRASARPTPAPSLSPEEEAEAIADDDLVLEEDSRSHTDLLRETLGAQIITEEPN